MIMADADRDCSYSSTPDPDEDLDLNDYEKFKSKLIKKKEFKNKLNIVLDTGKHSFVWNYFGGLEYKSKNIFRNKVFCNLCLQKEDFLLHCYATGTSTDTLKRHLMNTHDTMAPTASTDKKQTKLTNIFKTDAFSGSGSKSTSSLNTNNSKKFKLTRQIVNMCALDFEPFSICSRQGFQGFCQANGIDIDLLPNERTVAENGLSDVYEFCIRRIMDVLKSAPQNITLVMDCWTDNYKKNSYVNYKIHYCKNFKLEVLTLKTNILERPHTAVRIQNDIEKTLTDFGLINKRITAVTDNGANIVKAIKLMKFQHLPCFAHTLHLLISTDILKNNDFIILQNLMGKLKKIYKTMSYKHLELAKIATNKKMLSFLEMIDMINSIDAMNENDDRTSPYQYDELENVNMYADFNSNTLKNSNVTRWNSTLEMVRSFVKNKEIINVALGYTDNSELFILQTEFCILQEFNIFLEIFEEATKILQGCKYPTLNLSIMFLEKMKMMLDDKGKDATCEIIIDLYFFTKSRIIERFKINEYNVVASILDPSQKNMEYIYKYTSKSKEIILAEKLTENSVYVEKKKILVEKDNKNTNSDCSRAAKQARLSLLDALSPVTNSDVNNEIKQYIAIDVNRNLEPLEWWQLNKDNYPNLAVLAQIFHGIPATSASSEAAFSTAGGFMTAKRSSLHYSKLNKLCVVHDNFNLVMESVYTEFEK